MGEARGQCAWFDETLQRMESCASQGYAAPYGSVSRQILCRARWFDIHVPPVGIEEEEAFSDDGGTVDAQAAFRGYCGLESRYESPPF